MSDSERDTGCPTPGETADTIEVVVEALGDLVARADDEEQRLRALEERLGVTPPAASTGRSRDTALRRPPTIGPEEIDDIRRSALSTTPLRCRLDLTDVVLATIAGLAAVAVDMTVVRIPKDMTFDGVPQQGSDLTAALRSRSVPVVNELSRLAPVPFDSMSTGRPDLALSPRTHRADTFGHDPLVGLVYGVIDILRGTSTGVDRTGEMFVIDIADPTTTNPLAAVVVELGHLLSDVGSKAGLPLPGWSVLRMIDAGSIGGRTVGETARSMYLRGFDSWHLLSMATAPAAADLVLRAGWALRSELDPAWVARCDDEARLAGTTRTGSHPRFVLLALVAHGIACAGNIGRIVLSGGNPVAWNAAQWARFAQQVATWWRSSAARSTRDMIVHRSDINLESLLDDWPRSPGVTM